MVIVAVAVVVLVVVVVVVWSCSSHTTHNIEQVVHHLILLPYILIVAPLLTKEDLQARLPAAWQKTRHRLSG